MYQIGYFILPTGDSPEKQRSVQVSKDKTVGKKGPDAEAKAGWPATGEGWAISETSSKAGSAEVRSMQFPAAAML